MAFVALFAEAGGPSRGRTDAVVVGSVASFFFLSFFLSFLRASRYPFLLFFFFFFSLLRGVITYFLIATAAMDQEAAYYMQPSVGKVELSFIFIYIHTYVQRFVHTTTARVVSRDPSPSPSSLITTLTLYNNQVISCTRGLEGKL